MHPNSWFNPCESQQNRTDVPPSSSLKDSAVTATAVHFVIEHLLGCYSDLACSSLGYVGAEICQGLFIYLFIYLRRKSDVKMKTLGGNYTETKKKKKNLSIDLAVSFFATTIKVTIFGWEGEVLSYQEILPTLVSNYTVWVHYSVSFIC